LAPIFLSGIVLALVLSLEGKSLLHASAVHVEDSTAALAGDSGMGKSTITALLCRAGATLISDDLLRIDIEKDDIVCFEGTSRIRLRESAGEIAALFPAGASSVTADERLAISVEGAHGSPFSLDAVVIPKPSKTAIRVTVTQLAPQAALTELLRYPRVTGWQIREPLRAYFHALGEVSARVPVHVAEIPWGPPFDPGIASALLAEIGFPRAR
jgi:hypothetical protein